MTLYETQNKIGRASAEIQLVGAYIFGGILIITGIYLIISSLSTNCEENEEEKEEEIQKDDCKDTKKIKGIGGGICVFIAIGAVLFSRWWMKKTKEDDGFAQISAIGTEANIISNIFGK